MKKYFFPLMSLVLALGAASCSDSDDAPVAARPGANADGTVTLTCKVPAGNLRSRAIDAGRYFGDGTEATHLQYAIYDESGAVVASSTTAGSPAPVYDAATKSFSLNVPAPKGEAKYNAWFWADAFGSDDTASPYSIDYATSTMTVDYAKSAALLDRADAFTATRTITATTSGGSVVLTRPFMQLCLLTTPEDLAAHPEYKYSAIGVNSTSKGYPTKLNLLTGALSELASTATTLSRMKDNIAAPDLTSSGITRKLVYIAMGYMLPANTAGTGNIYATSGNKAFGIGVMHFDPSGTGLTTAGNTGCGNANERVIIAPASTSHGLLTDEFNVTITTSPDFETGDYINEI